MTSHQLDGYRTITPQSITPNPAETIAFIERVFDGKLIEKYDAGETITHAEVVVGDSRMMLGASNDNYQPFPLTCHVYVADVDAAFAVAVELGARTKQAPADQFYGDRTAVVVDSQGNQWSIATHLEDVDAEELRRRFRKLVD